MTRTDLEKLEALHSRGAESIIGIHNAFPAMAVALREAWERDERVMSDERMSEAQILATIRHEQEQKDEAIRQRDTATEELIAASREIEQIKHERDEARAEITRLCDLVTQAAVSEPVQATNLPFNLIPTDHWNRIRAEAERLSRKDDK